MNMKEHMLTALIEQLNEWEMLLSGLDKKQIAAPLTGSEWTIKDVMVHLMAWQQRSIARLEAAKGGHEPVYPQWLPGVKPDTEGTTEAINAWIYAAHKDEPWEQVHLVWHDGFVKFLELGQGFEERELLDSDTYAWMEGYSLADVLLGSYDHHREHLEWVKKGMTGKNK